MLNKAVIWHDFHMQTEVDQMSIICNKDRYKLREFGPRRPLIVGWGDCHSVHDTICRLITGSRKTSAVYIKLKNWLAEVKLWWALLSIAHLIYFHSHVDANWASTAASWECLVVGAVLAIAHDDFTSPNPFLDSMYTADVILLPIISLQMVSCTLWHLVMYM